MELSEKQVALVQLKLEKLGITYPGLNCDLTDHICCMIEHDMESGKSFELSLTIAMNTFGNKNLRNIQAETLLLLHLEKSYLRGHAILGAFALLPACLIWTFPGNWGLDFIAGLSLPVGAVSVLVMFALLGLAWAHEFPRWSMPVLTFVLLSSAYLMGVAIPSLTGSREVLGWRALGPLTLTVLTMILLKPKFQPFSELYNRIVADKSLLFYGLYGALPMAIGFALEEVHFKFDGPIMLLLTFLVVLGAYSYLRRVNKWQKIAALVLASLLSMSIAKAMASHFWMQF
jgi:hypothetical protein